MFINMDGQRGRRKEKLINYMRQPSARLNAKDRDLLQKASVFWQSGEFAAGSLSSHIYKGSFRD